MTVIVNPISDTDVALAGFAKWGHTNTLYTHPKYPFLFKRVDTLAQALEAGGYMMVLPVSLKKQFFLGDTARRAAGRYVVSMNHRVEAVAEDLHAVECGVRSTSDLTALESSVRLFVDPVMSDTSASFIAIISEARVGFGGDMPSMSYPKAIIDQNTGTRDITFVYPTGTQRGAFVSMIPVGKTLKQILVAAKQGICVEGVESDAQPYVLQAFDNYVRSMQDRVLYLPCITRWRDYNSPQDLDIGSIGTSGVIGAECTYVSNPYGDLSGNSNYYRGLFDYGGSLRWFHRDWLLEPGIRDQKLNRSTKSYGAGTTTTVRAKLSFETPVYGSYDADGLFPCSHEWSEINWRGVGVTMAESDVHGWVPRRMAGPGPASAVHGIDCAKVFAVDMIPLVRNPDGTVRDWTVGTDRPIDATISALYSHHAVSSHVVTNVSTDPNQAYLNHKVNATNSRSAVVSPRAVMWDDCLVHVEGAIRQIYDSAKQIAEQQSG